MKKNSAFSLIELSIVILIIGILIAGVTQGSRLVGAMRLATARQITQSSPVSSISDLVLWLETTSEKSLATGTTSFTDIDSADDSTAIGRWNDINPQSGTKNNATQATGANQPLYRTGTINNLPSLSFNGTAQELAISNLTMITPARGITAFFVAKTPSTIGNTDIYDSLRIDGMLATGFGSTGSNTANCGRWIYAGSWQGSWNPTGALAIPVSTAAICSIRFNGTTVQGWTNGGSQDTATAVSGSYLAAATAVLIGSGNGAEYFSGNIAEVIVFNRALKTEERQAIEAYLGKKWGIKIS